MYERHQGNYTQKRKLKNVEFSFYSYMDCIYIFSTQHIQFLFVHYRINLDKWKWFKCSTFLSYTRRTKLTSLIYSPSLFTAWERSLSRAKINYLIYNINVKQKWSETYKLKVKPRFHKNTEPHRFCELSHTYFHLIVC